MESLLRIFARRQHPPLQEAMRLVDDLESARSVLAKPGWDSGDLHRGIRYLEMDTFTVGRWVASRPGGATDGASLVNAGRELSKVSRWLDDTRRSIGWAGPPVDISAADRASFTRLLHPPIDDALRVARSARSAMEH